MQVEKHEETQALIKQSKEETQALIKQNTEKIEKVLEMLTSYMIRNSNDIDSA
jgi:ATP-dependent Zn protease